MNEMGKRMESPGKDYSSLFSRNKVLHWASGNLSYMDQIISRYEHCIPFNSEYTYINFIRHAYSVLRSTYRNEYVVKNELLNNLILPALIRGEIGNVFSEFRIARSIVDIAVFLESHSIAYEIKTELDGDSRLQNQIENYKRVFNRTYIVVPARKVKYYEKYSYVTGIITYDFNSEEIFSVYQESEINNKVSPGDVIQILHTKEYKSIVQDFYGSLPDMTSFTQYQKCKDLIGGIPEDILNRLFVQQAIRRVSSQAMGLEDSLELNQVFLSLKMSKREKAVLLGHLNKVVQV